MRDVIKVGIDAGGTFTDFVIAWPDGRTLRHKEASDREDPSAPVRKGLAALAPHLLAGEARLLVVHGTTIGLNYLLQGHSPRIGLVVSSGTRDMLEIARQKLADHLNLHAPRPNPGIPRQWIREVSTRIDAAGALLRDAGEVELDAVAAELRALSLDVVIVSLVNAPVNPDAENGLVETLAARLPKTRIIAATGIWPEVREYERTVAAMINARILPLLDGYLSRLSGIVTEFAADSHIQLTTSAGGVMGMATARERPIETLLSGPASGAIAAGTLVRHAAIDRAVTFDMGGTSADIAVLVDGTVERSMSARIGALPLMMPVVGITSIGAGGGSILSVDALGGLKVGPESAGSTPGPVAYGKGGIEPTVTDCYVATGIIDPDNFLGGRLKLDREAAKAALLKLGARLGLDSAEAVAEAGLRLATARMSTELLKTLAEGGHDPQLQTLVPFGGAGPTHAAILADDAGVAHVAVPRQAATFCAFGAVVSDIRRDWIRSVGIIGKDRIDTVRRIWETLEAEGLEWAAGEGASASSVRFVHELDMRYAGQSHNLVVTISAEARAARDFAAVAEALHVQHERLYGFRESENSVEIVSVRLSVIAPTPPIEIERLESGGGDPVPRGIREIFHHGVWREARVYARAGLQAGGTLRGPAVVEQEDTTTFVPPGWRCTADDSGLLRLNKESGHAD